MKRISLFGLGMLALMLVFGMMIMGCQVEPQEPTTINTSIIAGVAPPVTGAVPVTEITENSQFTGTVAWQTETGPHTGNFTSGVVYTAVISLKAKTGYTFKGVAADFFTVAGANATNPAGASTVTAVFPPAASGVTVNTLAISGLTPPVAGATPQTTVTGTLQILGGTAQWTDEHGGVFSGNFQLGVVYKAVITLTANPGFTFEGVAKDAFTVVGAESATNDADSGVVTAVFAKTATAVNIAAITGVTAPVAGANPVTAITPTDQFTGTVAWSPEFTADGRFASGTDYTATITLTAADGYNFAGVTAGFFTVAGADAANLQNTGVVTAVFPRTAATVTTLTISGLTPPVAGANRQETVGGTLQISGGTVQWVTAADATFTGPFVIGTSYKAIITLTAADNFTFFGVEAGSFIVPTATNVTNPVNSGVVTAVFPPAQQVVNIPAIVGVTVPVLGAVPVTTITGNAQFTGAVTWEPPIAPGERFAEGTVYIATIELTAQTSFSFAGVAENFFTVAGTSVDATNPPNEGVVTAIFPITDTVINMYEISGVSIPVPNREPSTTISETGQYEGTIAWFNNETNAPLSGNFAEGVIYRAVITLTPKQGFILQGVEANKFTVNGATSVAYAAGSDVITAVFPRTAATVTIKTIGGVTPPAYGQPSATTVTSTDQFTGSITWHNVTDNNTPLASGAAFAQGSVYRAIIELEGVSTYGFAGVSNNFFEVAGATTVANNQDSGVVTAVFPITKEIVTLNEILGVTEPVTDGTPSRNITENEQYSGTITWDPVIASGGVFEEGEIYTATIKLTLKAHYVLDTIGANFFTVANTSEPATFNAATSEITAKFAETDKSNLITFIPDNGEDQWTTYVTDGHAIPVPAKPHRAYSAPQGLYAGTPPDEYIFDYWYEESAGEGTAYVFDTTINGPVTLKAKWTHPNPDDTLVLNLIENAAALVTAVSYIGNNPGKYTILLDGVNFTSNNLLAPGTTSMTLFHTHQELTIKGIGDTPSVIQNPFYLNNTHLILDEKITLNASNNDHAVHGWQTGTLTMKKGSKITKSSGTNASSYILTFERNSSFIMDGGEISDIAVSLSGGTPAYFGYINLINSTFEMNDGKITNNNMFQADYNTQTPPGYMGVVNVGTGGKFIMNGGEITGNKLSFTPTTTAVRTLSAGVYVATTTSSFEMNGGTITGNTTNFYQNDYEMDVYFADPAPNLNLTGNATIGALMLHTNSGNNTQIIINPANWSGSIDRLLFHGSGVTNINDSIGLWMGRTIVRGVDEDGIAVNVGSTQRLKFVAATDTTSGARFFSTISSGNNAAFGSRTMPLEVQSGVQVIVMRN